MRNILISIALLIGVVVFWLWNSVEVEDPKLQAGQDLSEQEKKDARRANPDVLDGTNDEPESETYDPKSSPFNLTDMTTIISGVVIDQTNKPLPGAKVTLSFVGLAMGVKDPSKDADAAPTGNDTPMPDTTTTCNDQGKFKFAPVKRTEEIWITAVDAENKRAGQRRFSGSNRLIDLRIKVFLGSKIKGQILDANGSPVVGVKVGVIHTDNWNPRKPIELANGDATALSDKDGRFLLSGLQPGALFVDIIDEKWVLEDHKSIVLGEDSTLDLLLQASSGLTIEGVVLNEDRLPISGAQIVVRPEGGGWRENKSGGITETDKAGNFKLMGLKPGLYTVFANGGYQVERIIDGQPESVRASKNGVRKHVASGSGPFELLLK